MRLTFWAEPAEEAEAAEEVEEEGEVEAAAETVEAAGVVVAAAAETPSDPNWADPSSAALKRPRLRPILAAAPVRARRLDGPRRAGWRLSSAATPCGGSPLPPEALRRRGARPAPAQACSA